MVEAKGEKKVHTLERQTNIVYIGKKNFMRYVTAVTTQFTVLNNRTVMIIARGNFIKTAIDVAEVVCRQFLVDRLNKKVSIDSKEFADDSGKTIRISTITIELELKDKGVEVKNDK